MGVLIMTTAEGTTEVFKPMFPNDGEKIIFIDCTSTNAADYITVTDLTIVKGFYLMSSTGATIAAGTCSTSTNVITLSNGATGTKIWHGFCWGV